MPRPEPRRLFAVSAPFLWLAYLVTPVDGWGLFSGRPLGLGAAAALAAVCWLWFVRRSLPFPRTIAIALAAKVLVGPLALVPRGFDARYYANPDFAGAPERSTEPWGASITRVDKSLAFGDDQDVDLPLSFFNDTRRFNFYRETEPAREALPFSVAWQGLWRVTGNEPQQIYVRAPGGAVQVVVDRFHATIPATDLWTTDLTPPPGFHRVSVSLATAQGGARRFEAGRIVDGRRVPFDEAVVFRRAVSPIGLAVDRLVRWASTIFDALLTLWLTVTVLSALDRAWRIARPSWDVHATLALLWITAIVDAFVFARPALGRMITLSGGNDWLTYEDLARDIGLNGLLMLSGSTPGHGQAFYYQPLYPYFLAACHWLFGESLFGPYLIQRLLAGATVIALWRITARLFGESTGGAGLVVAWVVVYAKFAYWSGILLSEAVFVPLTCAWLLLLVRFATPGPVTLKQALAIGGAGGVATLSRSTMMLAWPLAAAAVWVASARGERRYAATVVAVASMAAVTSLATARNWIVARAFVPVATSGSVNLAIGNAPPMRIVTPPERVAAYRRLGVDENTEAVLEYARQQPASFVRGLWRKALYTLGWYRGLVPEAGASPFYLATWMSALAGLFLVNRGMTPVAVPGSAWALSMPWLLAIAHFAAAVIFFPHVYGDRLIIPFYVLLVPYAAMWITWVHRAALAAELDLAGVMLFAMAFGLALWPLTGGPPWSIDVSVVAGAVVLGGLVVAGLPRVTPGIWPYAAYALAMLVWALHTGTAQASAATAAEWLFLLVALTSGVLVASGRVHRGVAAITIGGCGVLAMAMLARAPIAEAFQRAFTDVSFEAVAVLAALGGVTALFLVAAGHLDARQRRALAWIAGAALAISAIAQLGIVVYPDRSLLRGMRARVGIAGSLAYALIWIRASWPTWSAGSVALRLLQGMVGGIFTAELFGVNLHPPGGTVLLAAGLACGAVETGRQAMHGAAR